MRGSQSQPQIILRWDMVFRSYPQDATGILSVESRLQVPEEESFIWRTLKLRFQRVKFSKHQRWRMTLLAGEP